MLIVKAGSQTSAQGEDHGDIWEIEIDAKGIAQRHDMIVTRKRAK